MADAVASRLAIFLGAIFIMYSGYVIYDMLYTQNKALAAPWEVLQYRPEIIDDADAGVGDQSKIKEINEDYRAWLTVYDTHIDYPVMQGDNDLYYSSHDVYRNSTLTGSIYLSSRNSGDFSDPYNLVYGHHMDNGAMFGDLGRFLDGSFLSRHRRGMLVTSEGAAYDLTFFATVKTQPTNGIIYEPRGNLTVLMDFVSRSASARDMSGLGPIGKVLALSTCTDSETGGRLVVFAAMEQRDVPMPPVSAPRDSADDTAGERKPDLVSTGTILAEVDAIDKYWALMNIVIVIVMAYVLVPLPRLRGKYARKRTQDVADSRSDGRHSSDMRFWAGVAIEALLLATAIAVLVVTGDIAGQMVIIDWWTLPLLVMLALSVAVDAFCAQPHHNG